MQLNMNESRANAEKAILSLLSSLPTDAASIWRTADELTALLKRGGVSASLESDLLSSALRYANIGFKNRFDAPRREMINGKKCTNYRFIKSFDNSSPAQQRKKRPLPTLPTNYFQDDEKYQPHLNAILKYYSDKNSSVGRSSTSTATAAAASTDETAASVPTITLGALNGSREIAEIEQRHQMFRQLHASCGDLHLSTEPVRKGFGIREIWHCDNCGQDFAHDTDAFVSCRIPLTIKTGISSGSA